MLVGAASSLPAGMRMQQAAATAAAATDVTDINSPTNHESTGARDAHQRSSPWFAVSAVQKQHTAPNKLIVGNLSLKAVIEDHTDIGNIFSLIVLRLVFAQE